MSTRLDNVIKSFNVTEHALDDRKGVGLYIESLASLIVDRFYDHLMSNQDFLKSLSGSDLPRLKRIKTEFLIALFNDEFNEELFIKLSHLYIDAPIRINKYIIASVFEILQESILDISSVNELLKRDLKIILKFLHIAEFIIQDEFLKSSSNEVMANRTTLFVVLETLYEMLTIHKNKNEELLKLWEDKKLKKTAVKELPVSDANSCSFKISLLRIKDQFPHTKDFSIDIDNISRYHDKYHNESNKLYKLVENEAPFSKQVEQVNIIKEVSTTLFEYISKPFEHSSSLTFLSINSGIRFIQKYNSIINETKFIPFNNPKKIVVFLKSLIQEAIGNSLAWAIDEFDVNDSRCIKDSEIYEQIVLSNSTFYICLTIKDIPYKSFIIDVIKIFLEILRTTITNREKEHSLIVLADKAESANRSKDIFLANMSHELRTPLNAIIGFSQILQRREEIPQNLRSYIKKISIAGNNLLNLVNTILDFAKLEAGKISYNPKMTLIPEMTKEVLVITTALAEAKNITLNFPGKISLALYADPQLIKQVLINLLSNAIKFTPNGGSVTLSIKFDTVENEFIISVCDTGIGISKEGISKLFTPFTQIDNDFQSKSKGTGLGLTITKRIIEDLHGGRIWVESEEGEGSCFHIALPVPDELSKIELYTSKQSEAENLLLVEDNEEYVDILVNKLNHKFNITVINSINKAKELITENSYDKIILDFFLIDGISSEILFFMESKAITTPVYIISAEDDFKLVDHIGESKNIVGVFNKIDAELICDTLNRTNVE